MRLEQTLCGEKIAPSSYRLSGAEDETLTCNVPCVMTHMLIHVLGQVGNIQVGVVFVGQFLELRVERFLVEH